MGAACQKQFQNIPNQLPQLQQYQQYQKQKQRLSINTIKLQHKHFKPNSKNISIGMIDTILQPQNNQSNTKNNYIQNNNVNKSKNVNYSKSSVPAISDTKNNQIFKVTTINGKQFDQQRLHATARPFQGNQTINLSYNQQIVTKQNRNNRQPLDFNFYYSLALSEYNYREYAQQYKKQYQNLYVCEQQDRNGVKYIGQWKDQKTIHGNGVIQSNTSKYIGQFRNGLKHFHGRQIEKQQIYQGEFVDGRRKGKGIKYTPQCVQQGQFNQYLIKGKITYTNGNTYQGQLLHNKYNGKGTFINPTTKTNQQGQYKNGKLHGMGRIKINNNLVYQGIFKQDMKHGKGTYYWNDLQYYTGQYCNNKKHGKGILIKGNRKYVGNFNNGNLHGYIQVYQKNNKGQQYRRVYNYNNGMRLVEQQTQQSIIFDQYGLPTSWQDIVVRKKQQQTSTKQQDISSSYKIPMFKFPSHSNLSSFNFSKNQSDPNDLSSIRRSQNLLKQYDIYKKPSFPSVIAQQARLSSDSHILPTSIINQELNQHLQQHNMYIIPYKHIEKDLFQLDTHSINMHDHVNKSNSFQQVNRTNHQIQENIK